MKKTLMIIAIATAMVVPKAKATLTFVLSDVINGSSPASTSPWLTAEFTDVVGGVQLTLTSSLNVSDEFISRFGFNVRPDITPSLVTMTTDLNAPIAAQLLKTTQNDQKLNGNAVAGFDFLIKWNTSSGPGRLNGTDVDTFTFVFSGLTESDFDYATAAGVRVGAKVQGIPGGLSGEIGAYDKTDEIPVVPEPATIVAGALLLLPFGASTLRILRKKHTA